MPGGGPSRTGPRNVQHWKGQQPKPLFPKPGSGRQGQPGFPGGPGGPGGPATYKGEAGAKKRK